MVLPAPGWSAEALLADCAGKPSGHWRIALLASIGLWCLIAAALGLMLH